MSNCSGVDSAPSLGNKALYPEQSWEGVLWSPVFSFCFVLGFLLFFLNSPGDSVPEVFDIFLKHWLLFFVAFAFVLKLTFTAMYLELLLRPLWHFHIICSKTLWKLVLKSEQLLWEAFSTSLLSTVIYSQSSVRCPMPWSTTKHCFVGHCITCFR